VAIPKAVEPHRSRRSTAAHAARAGGHGHQRIHGTLHSPAAPLAKTTEGAENVDTASQGNRDLENAIDGLHLAFAGSSVPAEVEVSSRRDPEEELGALRRFPLRNVPATGIDNYAEHALTTVGDVNLLKYALPRLLELTACEALLTDAETVLSKLELSGWRAWPEAERLAILAILQVWWARVLELEVRFSEWRARYDALFGHPDQPQPRLVPSAVRTVGERHGHALRGFIRNVVPH